mmetsp:Transcript_13173/g.19933  ORF Transcript_13173/g.19933 Transcript_13173/m.19933 type:complete len:204 (-) Transcript_13173:77-688(-)
MFSFSNEMLLVYIIVAVAMLCVCCLCVAVYWLYRKYSRAQRYSISTASQHRHSSYVNEPHAFKRNEAELIHSVRTAETPGAPCNAPQLLVQKSMPLETQKMRNKAQKLKGHHKRHTLDAIRQFTKRKENERECDAPLKHPVPSTAAVQDNRHHVEASSSDSEDESLFRLQHQYLSHEINKREDDMEVLSGIITRKGDSNKELA